MSVLAAAIRGGRLERGWTVAELAERVGVSLGTIRSIERGRPGVALGTALEAATLVGVPLFHEDALVRRQHRALQEQTLALLPSTARRRAEVDDDF